MINNHHKIAFIHINKTGGSSIERALGWRNISPTHSTLKELTLKHKNIDKYYKFSFVRNPYSKMVSQYHHRKQNMVDQKVINLNFKDWVKNLDELGFKIKGTGNQLAWLSNQEWVWDEDKQIYTKRPEKIEIGVDFIGFFEALNEDWKHLQNEVGINPLLKLPHIRKSNHAHYSEYYDDETQEIVYTRFKDDFEYFNYKFDTK